MRTLFPFVVSAAMSPLQVYPFVTVSVHYAPQTNDGRQVEGIRRGHTFCCILYYMAAGKQMSGAGDAPEATAANNFRSHRAFRALAYCLPLRSRTMGCVVAR